jgi:hypothetical protein
MTRGDHGILTFNNSQQRTRMCHELFGGTTVVYPLQSGKVSQQTAQTAFTCSVARAGVREPCAERREDGETSPRAGTFQRSTDERWVGGMTTADAVIGILW